MVLANDRNDRCWGGNDGKALLLKAAVATTTSGPSVRSWTNSPPERIRRVARSLPVERRFVIAVLIEAAWEIVENTPMIINRYREATAALGYTGDSVLNSMSDIVMMGIGFLAARKLPVWAAVLLFVILETVPLFVIRDNLLLNIWTLLAPNAAVQAWQAGP